MTYEVIALGLYLGLMNSNQLAGYLIQGMNGLVVGKIRRPKSSRGKPLLQNYHGKPGSTLSMHQHHGLLLFHGLLHGCYPIFHHATR